MYIMKNCTKNNFETDSFYFDIYTCDKCIEVLYVFKGNQLRENICAHCGGNLLKYNNIEDKNDYNRMGW